MLLLLPILHAGLLLVKIFHCNTVTFTEGSNRSTSPSTGEGVKSLTGQEEEEKLSEMMKQCELQGCEQS